MQLVGGEGGDVCSCKLLRLQAFDSRRQAEAEGEEVFAYAQSIKPLDGQEGLLDERYAPAAAGIRSADAVCGRCQLRVDLDPRCLISRLVAARHAGRLLMRSR